MLMTSSGGRCPICTTPQCTCGPPTTTVPVDQRLEEAGVGALREYTVTVNGIETVMNLNEDDAKRLGGTPTETAEPEQKRRTASDKSRTAQNKADG